MCGIAGWLSFSGDAHPEVIDVMLGALDHRGPDGSGNWVAPDGSVALGHRRLSIIDLSDMANQPMWDERGRAVIVFNGEIYNHRQLRRELERDGVRFRTDHSDTECLLNGYLHWGIEKVLSRVIGMFSFAVYDKEKSKCYLVRDRVGVKPLYVSEIGSNVVFASEIKALLKHPLVEAKLDSQSFVHYLTFRSTLAPNTLLENVRSLKPGELYEIDYLSNRVASKEWWNPLLTNCAVPTSLNQARDELESLLLDSVKLRLEADVPIGLFLSGGVDSAYLLQLMSELQGKVSTFTVSYPGHTDYNEHDAARRLAEDAGATHHDVQLGAGDFAKTLPTVAYYQDEPIAAPVCTSVYFLSHAAREAGCKVVLAGEGSDEIFVGYDSWLQTRTLQRWNDTLPKLPSRLLAQVPHFLASLCMSPFSSRREILRRLANGEQLFWGGALDFASPARDRLLGPQLRGYERDTYSEVIAPLREEYLNHGSSDDITKWMSFVDLKFRLPQLMLPRLDKMGMAASIEGRVPFLDHRIVEFTLSLPPEWRGAVGKIGKPLFKSVAARRLSRDFVYQKKRGFQAPVKEWRGENFGRVYLPALREFARHTGLLDDNFLERLLNQRDSRLYFSLVNFMLWYLTFIENVLPNKFGFELRS